MLLDPIVSSGRSEASDVVAVLLVLIPTIGSITAAYFAFKSHRSAAETNDAVNHRHQQPEGTPRLFDAVLELLAWKRRWDTLPDDLDSAGDLEAKLDQIDERLADNDRAHQVILGELRDHVAWEMETKYKADGDGPA